MLVRNVMRTDLITLQAGEPLINAVEATSSEHVRHLPILDGEELVGIVTVSDIKHAMPSPLLESSEEQYRKFLNETPVSRVMRRAPITASPAHKLRDVVRLMIRHKIGAVPIVQGGKLVGILSELDVLTMYLDILDKLE